MADVFIERLAKSIYDAAMKMIQDETGLSLDRICEFAKADKEGRIIIIKEETT